MGGNSAMSFSNMEECYFPLQIKSWLLAPGERGKEVKEEIWQTAQWRCVCPKVMENKKQNKKQLEKHH